MSHYWHKNFWQIKQINLLLLFLLIRSFANATDIPGRARVIELKPLTDTTAVLTGLDLLVQHNFAPLKGKRVALLANSASLDRTGKHIFDLFREKYTGQVCAQIMAGTIHAAVTLTSSSELPDVKNIVPATTFLDTANYRLSAVSLNKAELLIIDLQDNGWRESLSIAILVEALQYCAQAKIELMLLDRPNPLGAVKVEGPLSVEGPLTLGLSLPARPGLTLGEVALLIVGENWLPLPSFSLQVIKMANYRRAMDLYPWQSKWRHPDERLTSRDACYLYGALQLLETTNLSYGEGTDLLYQVVGAPWLNGQQLAELLRGQKLAGVDFYPIEFVPRRILGNTTPPRYVGETCSGVQVRILDWQAYEPIKTGGAIIYLIAQLYPHRFRWTHPARSDAISGSTEFRTIVNIGGDWQGLYAYWQAQLSDYQKLRLRYLLYED